MRNVVVVKETATATRGAHKKGKPQLEYRRNQRAEFLAPSDIGEATMLPPVMADKQCSRSQVARPAVSIIVPVSNESALIRSFLVDTRRRAPCAAIVVSDGRSSDTSAA